MIGIKIHGRLGNQLFQYAMVYTSAIKLNTSFYLDESIDSFYASKYFNIPENPYTLFRRSIFNLKGFRKLFANQINRYFEKLQHQNKLTTVVGNGNENPASELLSIKDGALLEGFFQSEKYFETQEQNIKKLFAIKAKHISAFKKYSEHLGIGKRMVTVHVRRGDYLSANWQLPLSYYRQAIEKIHHSNNFYVFITDDRDFVAKEFADIEPKHVSFASEIIDFQFLVNADINILSNSSFSWWGAYLNLKNAQTIAPALWLGQSEVYPNSILRSHWQLI